MTSPARTGPPPSPPLPEPAERGRLVISTLALRRIAEYVADCTPGTTRGRRRRGWPQRTTARVRTDGDIVHVELAVAMIYPRPVQRTAAELRRTVATEINRLTGRRVRTVAVTVVALQPESQPRVR